MSNDNYRKRISFTTNDECTLVVYLDSIASVCKELSGSIITTVGGFEYEIKLSVDEVMRKIEELENDGTSQAN